MARSVLQSVAEFEPQAERFVFIIDDIDAIELIAEGTVLRPSDVFEPSYFAELAHRYQILELATAVKPALLRFLLDRGFDRVLYLDPDIQVFAPLEPVLEALVEHDIVLTPATTEPLTRSGMWPFEMMFLQIGVFNLGFIAVADRPQARRMLTWWEERLKRHGADDVPASLFTDQRWMDVAPTLFDRLAILRHRGCNVAYWNLIARPLADTGELRLQSGEPVIFFHFSNFDPRYPDRITIHPSGIDLDSHPRVRTLLAAYAERLRKLGHFEQLRVRYGYARFSLRPFVRRMARRVAWKWSLRYAHTLKRTGRPLP